MQTKKKIKLTDPRNTFKPFHYPWCFDAWLQSEQMHWLMNEVPMIEDVKDWKEKLSDSEKTFLTNILRFFTQGDIDVSEGYVKNYLPYFPQPEVRMMLLSFGAREAIHVAAYSHLIETLGMPETTYNEFFKYSEMKEKHEYVLKFEGSEDTRNIAKNIAVFSAFTEGMQLFSSFIMLLNFPRHGTMKGMGQIISWSIADEAVISGTEILTKDNGWIPIENVTLLDEIYQYDTDTKLSSFVRPNKIQHVQRDTTYVFEGKDFHQHVSPNHRMIIEKNNDICESTAEKIDILEKFKFILSGKKDGKLKSLNEKHKELCIMSAKNEIEMDWVLEILPEISSSWAKEFLLLYKENS